MSDDDAFKTIVGRKVCGVCGAKVHSRNPRSDGHALCKKHSPKSQTCKTCFFIGLCRDRVRKKAWVYCEQPDLYDITRAINLGLVLMYTPTKARKEQLHNDTKDTLRKA